MKNSQKGFIVPVLVAIIALLVIGGGIYIYKNKKVETPVVDTVTQQTNTETPSVATNQTILNSLVTDWKKIGPNILPGFPAVNQAFYGYPDIIQFIGNNRIVISYEDDFNPLFAVLSYDTNQKQFSYLDGLRSSPFKVSETLWNTWKNKYGDVSFAPQTYQFSSTRTGDVVYSFDWKLTTKNPFVSSNKNVSNGKCGLTITSPLPNSQVSFPLIVRGTIDNSNSQNLGCSWQMFEGVAGTAQFYVYLTEKNSEGNIKGWTYIGKPVFINGVNFALTFNFPEGGFGGSPIKIILTEENPAVIRPSLIFELPLMLK